MNSQMAGVIRGAPQALPKRRNGDKMEVKRRYVVHSRHRLTLGIAIIGLGAIGLFFESYLTIIDVVNGDLYTYGISDWALTIFSIVVMIFFVLLGRFTDKKQKWPDYILEIYEDCWVRYQIKYRESESIEDEIYISSDMIVGIDEYKKKYYENKDAWYIQSGFGFTDGEKVYGPFLTGWLVEPKDIKEFDALMEWLKKKGEENVKRLGIKVPKSFAWYGIGTWEESEKGRKLKEEGEKLLR